MIDTIILCGKTDDAVDLAPTGPQSVEGAKKHWKWIRKHIEHSTYVCQHSVENRPTENQPRYLSENVRIKHKLESERNPVLHAADRSPL